MLYNMKELLTIAKENQFAVPAFNIGSLEILRAVMEVAEETNSPVILEIHPLEIEYLTDPFVLTVKEYAHKSKVPVVIHMDHGSNIYDVMRSIKNGYTSVMIDASNLPYEENVALTKKVVEAAHAVGVSVEAELGALAGIEDGESVANAKVTDPKDAAKFVELTNVDAMALSIGNAHGLYKGVPNLHYDVLEETAKLIDTPLVLHGGTGLSKEQFAKCIDLGVKKVNIGTEIKRSFMDTFTNLHLQDKEAYDFVNIPQKAKEAVANTVEQNLRFFAEGWKSELK